MASIIFYNPEDLIVPNKVIEYMKSVNTPDYIGLPNIIINPDLSNVQYVSMKYWKVSEEQVVEMDVSEKDAINEAVEAKTIKEKKYQVLEYDSSKRLIKEQWFYIDNGNGTYSKKVQEVSYVYNNSILLSKIEVTYYYDGTVAEEKIWDFYEGSNKNQKILKLRG